MAALHAMLALLAAATPLPAAARVYLASIDAVAIGPGEFVSGFSIDTWGVEVVAVCHIPPGWRITAGGSAAPDGVIAGEGSHGVTWLRGRDLRQLHDLVLVRLSGPVQRAEVRTADEIRPATFSGLVKVGRYGDDNAPHKQPLSYLNVRLTPATHCPVALE